MLAATLTAGWSLPAQDAAGWRFWGAQDGLPESFVSSVVADRAGNLWSIHGTSGMSRMDGYAVDTKIRALRFPRTLLWMQDGVWTLDLGGLQRLSGRNWEFHPLKELKGIDPVSPPALRAFGATRLLIVDSDWLAAYDPVAPVDQGPQRGADRTWWFHRRRGSERQGPGKRSQRSRFVHDYRKPDELPLPGVWHAATRSEALSRSTGGWRGRIPGGRRLAGDGR